MKPLAELDAPGVRAVLFDIDETLSTAGKLTAAAYTALEQFHEACRLVVPVTGRPAGWCDHIARMWPVDAGRLEAEPKYVTRAAAGAGFVEVVEQLLRGG